MRFWLEKRKKYFMWGFEWLRVIAETPTAVSGDRTFASAAIGTHSSRGTVDGF
jgi:hypothetical protein